MRSLCPFMIFVLAILTLRQLPAADQFLIDRRTEQNKVTLHSDLPDKIPPYILKIPRLTQLIVISPQLTKIDWQQFQKCADLTDLRIHTRVRTKLQEKEWLALQQLSSLKPLHLQAYTIPAGVSLSKGAFKNIGSIGLNATGMSPESLDELCQLPKLRSIILFGDSKALSEQIDHITASTDLVVYRSSPDGRGMYSSRPSQKGVNEFIERIRRRNPELFE